MPRKKRTTNETENTTSTATAVSEPAAATEAPMERPAYIDGPPTNENGEIAPGAEGKNWGPPYKAIFTSSAKGFELGENRRYKQRVFKFKDKPDAETLATLKENGFTYRAEERAWTIPANGATRLLTDRLASQFAGESLDRDR
jgi:hypothetical protein